MEVITMEKINEIKNNIMDYGKMKPMLRVRLMNPKTSSEYLKDKPHLMFCGLPETFFLQVAEDATIAVTDGLASAWGVSAEQMEKDAIRSTREAKAARFYSVEESITRKAGSEPTNLLEACELPEQELPLFALTTKEMRFGAGVIVDKEILKDVKDVLGWNFFILPSSIHEVLILPDTGNYYTKENLVDMVTSINGDGRAIEPEDVLADMVFYYGSYNEGIKVL